VLVVAPEGVVSWGAHLLDALDSEGKVKPDHRRRVALELAAYATNDGKGRDVGDPVHEAITEGRTLANEQRRRNGSPEVPYSSCTDLATWLLASMGCTDESLINRSDDGGRIPWQIGASLPRLVHAPSYQQAAAGGTPAAGDILFLTDRGGHVAVLRVWDELAGLATTDDYGQPYGRRRHRTLRRQGGVWTLDGRPLGGWLDLDQVPLDGPARLPDVVAEAVDG